MENSIHKLVFSVSFNLALFALFVFGLLSPIGWLSNIAIFTMWILGVLSVISIFGCHMTPDVTEALNNRPTWYKYVITITGVACSLAVVAKGFFIFGAIFIIADLTQGYYMWKSKT